jgi:hypothetical protein
MIRKKNYPGIRKKLWGVVPVKPDTRILSLMPLSTNPESRFPSML